MYHSENAFFTPLNDCDGRFSAMAHSFQSADIVSLLGKSREGKSALLSNPPGYEILTGP